jgi:hypothetical protein
MVREADTKTAARVAGGGVEECTMIRQRRALRRDQNV